MLRQAFADSMNLICSTSACTLCSCHKRTGTSMIEASSSDESARASIGELAIGSSAVAALPPASGAVLLPAAAAPDGAAS